MGTDVTPRRAHAEPGTEPGTRNPELRTGLPSCPSSTFGLAAANRKVLLAIREQTGGDLLLKCPRLGDERIEAAEQGSEFLGGEKALLAHTMS